MHLLAEGKIGISGIEEFILLPPGFSYQTLNAVCSAWFGSAAEPILCDICQGFILSLVPLHCNADAHHEGADSCSQSVESILVFSVSESVPLLFLKYEGIVEDVQLRAQMNEWIEGILQCFLLMHGFPLFHYLCFAWDFFFNIGASTRQDMMIPFTICKMRFCASDLIVFLTSSSLRS
jgi:hypothetical protein